MNDEKSNSARIATHRQRQLIRKLSAQLGMSRSKAVEGRVAAMSAAEASDTITRLQSALRGRESVAVPESSRDLHEHRASPRMIRFTLDLKAQLNEYVDQAEEQRLLMMSQAGIVGFSKQLQRRIADIEDYEGRTPKWRKVRPRFVNEALVRQGAADRERAKQKRKSISEPSCDCAACREPVSTGDPEMDALLNDSV